MSPEFEELSARLLALETVVGHLVTRLAVYDDDPRRWLATRKVLAMEAVRNVEQERGHGLANAMRGAITEFFAAVESAIGAVPAAE